MEMETPSAMSAMSAAAAAPAANPSSSMAGEDDDETAAAFAAISQHLEKWTSPRLQQQQPGGSDWKDVSSMKPLLPATTTTEYPYERNVMDWWNRELVDPAPKDDNDNEDDDEIRMSSPSSSGSGNKLRVTRTTSTKKKKQTDMSAGTPKRTTVERAATPIMSNSSKKKPPSKYVDSLLSPGSRGSLTSPLLRNLQDDNNDNNNNNMVDDDDDGGVKITNDSLMEDDDMISVNVQSPWAQPQDDDDEATPKPVRTPAWNKNRTGYYSSATPRALSSFRNQQYEYRRYHDGLLAYLKARRSLSDRMEMDQEEQALDDGMMIVATTDGSNNDNSMALALPSSGTNRNPNKLAHEESLAELEFLRTLKSACWERDPTSASESSSSTSSRDWASRREGNFWALLQELRSLGLAALLWADDERSLRQCAKAAAAFCEMRAMDVHATPKELLEGMAGNGSSNGGTPLLLLRRKRILTWLEHCFDQLVTAETNASVSMATRNNDDNDESNANNLSDRSPRHMEKVLRSCFSLVLAGRLEDARVLLRKAGQPWMAAKLGGGAPAGFEKVADSQLETVELVKVGNVNRPLWKRQMWKLSEKMNNSASSGSALPEDAAIHSLLANDYRSAMENSALRSWEKGLYSILFAMWGRSEDEQLHLHNNSRRACRPPFPGTLYEDCERSQLQATSSLPSLTERGVIDMLASASFEPMRGQENLCEAISSLLVGKSALSSYLLQETELLTTSDDGNEEEEPDDKVYRLRFVTHVLLYLDSLSISTTPVTIEGIQDAKNQALYEYTNHLANHEELWHLLVLYASLLPEDVIMNFFPTLLVRVEGEEERRMMVEQARELLSVGLDLSLLKIVVRSILAEEEDIMASDAREDGSNNIPSRSDIRKMKAIQWLCFFEEHAGDALIAANMLLRQFLLQDKLASAAMFLQDFLPGEVLSVAMNSTDSPNEEDNVDAVAANETYQALLGRARSEHLAFQSYLKAFRAVEEWRLVVRSTPASGSVVDDKVDTDALNEREQSIAKSMERREMVRQKRKVSQVIVEASETATNDIMRVLMHEGGWLADSDADTGFKDSSEEGAVRKEEIRALRSRLLPFAVKLYNEVCQETALWMWNSLLDGSPVLGNSPKEVLEALDENAQSAMEEDEVGSTVPLVSPRYWTHLALELAEPVSSDEFLIHDAFDASSLKEMMGKWSEIALADLTYS